MTNYTRHYFSVLAVLLNCLLAIGVAAQSLRLDARVSRDRVIAGEKFYYSVEMTTTDGTKLPSFDLPDFTPFRVLNTRVSPPSSSSIIINNDRIQSTLSQSRDIRLQAPYEPGLYTIPPTKAGSRKSVEIQVRVVEDSRVFPSLVVEEDLPLPFTSPERPEYDRMFAGQLFMRPVLDKTEFYVREPIPIEWEYYSSDVLSGTNLPKPSFRGPSDDQLQDFYMVQGKFPITNRSVTLDDTLYNKYNISAFVFFPIKEGKITVPGISAHYQLAFRGSGIFRRGFFNLIVPSKAPEIRVKPLPTKDRPNDFAGAVGQFRFYVEADTQSVKQGSDVITLTARLEGRGYMEAVPPPPPLISDDFTVIQDWGRQSQSTELKEPGVADGEAVWTMLIRAARAGEREIPEFSYPYFDPYTEQYERAPSHTIPIQVEPWAEYELLRAEEIAANTENAEAKTDEAEQEDFSYLDETEWPERGFLPEGHRPPWQAWTLIGLVVFWCTAFFFRAPGKRDRARRKDTGRLKRAKGEIEKLAKGSAGTSGNLAALNKAFRTYLAQHMDRSPEGITPESAQWWIETNTGNSEVAAEARDLLGETGAAQYMPVDLTPKDGARRALKIIKTIEGGKA